MKVTKHLLVLFIAVISILGFPPPASAQVLAEAVADLAADGLYSEQPVTSDISIASQTLASNDVAFAWLGFGDSNDVQAVATSLLEQLTSQSSRYETVLAVSDDGFAIDSTRLTDSQQEALLDASQTSFANRSIANGLLQVNNALPNSLASSSGSTSQLDPQSTPDSELEIPATPSTDTGTADANTSGGLPIFKIIIFAVIGFIAFKLFKSWMKRKRQKLSGPSGPFANDGNTGLNVPNSGQSRSPIGQKRSMGGLGGIIGSVLSGMAAKKVGGSLGSRNNAGYKSSSATSTNTQASRPKSGNIFSGGKIGRASRSGRGRSFRRSSSSRSGKGRSF